jgi:acyl-CoA reductase-like NAD-dependent aldehyde dehydrogenase
MRLNVRKTYKLFIGGQFPRTESLRHYAVRSPKGDKLLANACKGSRKDIRNAVVAARKAFGGWSARTTLNRGQILYRLAEGIESRIAELSEELMSMGLTDKQARAEVEACADACVYYAGWADKVHAVLGTVNPVAGPFFNFSFPEATGVVGIVAPETPALLGLMARMLPAIVCGNTVVIIPSETRPLCAITLGEILATSDVPAGVVNIVSGIKAEITPGLAAHMDVNAIDISGVEPEARTALAQAASDNVKRVIVKDEAAVVELSLWAIADFLETKTVWHPMGL